MTEQKVKFSTVSITLEDLERLQILADHMDKSNKQVFHDFIDMLWELGATYEKFNVSYDYYGKTCTVTVSGKNRVGLITPTKEIMEGFGYKKDEKTGRIIDTTEKPTEPTPTEPNLTNGCPESFADMQKRLAKERKQ